MSVMTVKAAQTIIAKGAAAMFKDKAQFLNTIDIEPSSSFGNVNGYQPGDTISINKPARFTMGTTADVTSTVQSILEDKVALTVARQRNVPIALTSAAIATDLDLKQWMKRVLDPAITTLVNGIEAEILADASKAVANTVGTPGSSLFDQSMMLQGRERLMKMLPPTNEFHALLDSTAMRLAGVARNGQFNDQSELSKLYKTGVVGRSDGFIFHENNLLPTHTNGNSVTGVQVNATISTQGATQIVLKGLTNTTGTVTAGQVFTVAGVFAVHPVTKVAYSHLQQFVILGNVTASGAGVATVDIGVVANTNGLHTTGSRQNISAFPAENAVVTFVGNASQSFTKSFGYHKSAFRFCSLPLIKPTGLHMAEQRTEDNITIRIIQDYQSLTDQMLMRVDVLYGFVAVRPEWSVALVR
jgi:hypothetical protein